jgi:nucleoside-diphosphate-sugar epimerase
MKVFVAGATGAVGRRLVPVLLAAGHEVVALTRSSEKAAALRAAGATPVVADALDREAVVRAVTSAHPDAIAHELTALAGIGNLRHFDRVFAATNRLRTEGTDILLAAARAAGTPRFVAQSYAGWPYAREGGPVKDEEAPLDPSPPASMRQTLAAIRHLEDAVTGAAGLEGIVLRYGGLYGPGTSMSQHGDHAAIVRKRRFPIIGNGGGVWSFVHVDDAAAATLAALELGAPGIYNVVDDDPAPVREWLPALAAALGAPPPRRLPLWLGRLAGGEATVSLMTQIRGASNAKARRELGWRPRWASWREGFREGLGDGAATGRAAEGASSR